MTQIQFFRGASGVSLPSHQDGAIFVVSRGVTEDNGNFIEGDIYVDIDNGQRLHIAPNSPVEVKTSIEWKLLQNITTQSGKVYVTYDGGDSQPTIKIGDGTSTLASLPIFTTVTADEKTFWNNKVTAYAEPSEVGYRLVLTKN